MSISRPIYKVMIYDFDGCVTLGIRDKDNPEKIKLNVENKFLSPAFLQLAKTGGYAFSMGCTHRCYDSMQKKSYAHDTTAILNGYKEYLNHQDPIDVLSWLTVNIPKNFTALSGLECIAVSTPDDFSQTAPKEDIKSQCGYGFKNILSVAEEGIKLEGLKYVLPEWKSTVHFPVDAYKSKKLFANKNAQLIQVLHFAKAEIDKLAREQYGLSAQPILEAHFFDDKLDILLSTRELDKASLPADIELKCYQHTEHHNICADLTKPLLKMNTMSLPDEKSSKALVNQATLLATQSLFKPDAVSVSTGLTKVCVENQVASSLALNK